MKKKMLALSLAVCMTAGLTACGGSKTESAGTTAAATEAAGTTAAAAATEAPQAEPIEKIVLWTNAHASDESIGKAICEQFKADTGVELEWVQYPREDYEDVMMAALMSCDEENLPDVIAAPDNMGVMLRQEIVRDLSGLIANNEEISRIIEKNPSLINEYVTDDGIYAIASSNFQSMTIWTRQDILDELNIGEIKSLDEFTEALRAIKAAHPEMIPLTGNHSMKVWEVISNWFGVTYSINTDENGQYYDPTLTPEYKEFMDYVKMLYSEGLVDQELPTNTSYGSVRKKFTSGQAAMTIMWDSTYATFTNGLASNNIPGEVGYIKAADNPENGGTFAVHYKNAAGPFVITTGVPDDQAQQVFDTFYGWMLANENGIITATLGPEGIGWEVVDGVYAEKEDVDIGNTLAGEPPVNLDFEYPFAFEDVVEKKLDIAEEIEAEVIKRESTLMKPYLFYDHQDYASIASDLDTKRTEVYYLYVTGQCDYDTFCKEYQNIADEYNLQNILDEMNAK